MGRGKVQDVKSKSEKNGIAKGKTEGTTEGNIKGAKTDKLKSTIGKMNLKITEGKNITTKEFKDWLETLIQIVEGQKQPMKKKAIDFKRKEENVADEEGGEF